MIKLGADMKAAQRTFDLGFRSSFHFRIDWHTRECFSLPWMLGTEDFCQVCAAWQGTRTCGLHKRSWNTGQLCCGCRFKYHLARSYSFTHTLSACLSLWLDKEETPLLKRHHVAATLAARQHGGLQRRSSLQETLVCCKGEITKACLRLFPQRVRNDYRQRRWRLCV